MLRFKPQIHSLVLKRGNIAGTAAAAAFLAYQKMD